MRKKCIAVIGISQCSFREQKLAKEVGKLIAKKGAILITGGLGGIMKYASKGAHKAGGLVIGVLPTSNANDANPYVDIAIVTGLGDARNVIIVSTADAIIAIGGWFGTLSEIAFALKRDKPLIGLGTWKLDEARLDNAKIIMANDAKDAVEKAFNKSKN